MAQESKNENRKQRIREAFHDGKQVERMPAREDMAPQHSDDVIYRVAPYCRVSTMSEMQAESFEIQQQYYNEYIAKHPNWTLVRIYADEGISATSVKNRKDFNNMIEDCKAGKIDLIVTKSVSRFARNVVDCIKYARDLRALSPPVGIYFETENINTLSQNGELLLTVLPHLHRTRASTSPSALPGVSDSDLLRAFPNWSSPTDIRMLMASLSWMRRKPV